MFGQAFDGRSVFLGEEFDGEAFDGTEHEGEAFEAPGFVVEVLDVVLGVPDGVDAFEVGGGVANVLMTGAVQGGNCRRTEAEVVIASPIAVIVFGSEAGECVVGGLVVFEASADHYVIGESEHFGVDFRVVGELAFWNCSKNAVSSS